MNADAPTSPAHAVETHISWLFFSPDRAYKLLKPVRMPFLDHRASEARIEAIDRELELNRRLAPDVYLGVADVHEDSQLVDRMLVMRRMPADRQLSARVYHPDFSADLRSIAKSIANFHSGLAPVTEAPMASVEVLTQNWKDNFKAIEPFVGSILDPDEFASARTMAMAYVEHRAPLFADRAAKGFVRDGHGDLIADDIYCLDDGPRLLDCLAFRDDWRIGDVLSDIGFLVMDVQRLAGI